ncbi:hypothetical protein M9458_014284 [Cirrhinus mrigala]|uniref:Uncharacterized protein n=1 Tax=Cirrhinus mrigala TaxID=683832 RepID=A0ABD0QZI8_CIRMR
MQIFSPLGSAEDVILPDPSGSNTSNIPLSSPLLHPSSTSAKKETSELTSSLARSHGSLDLACEDPRSKDSKRKKRAKPPNTSSSRDPQRRRIKSLSAENLLDLGDTEKSKSLSKAKDKARSHKENLQQSTRDSQKNRKSCQHSRSVSPQKSKREGQEAVIGEAQGRKEERRVKGTPSIDQKKSDAERRKKQESRGRKRNENQDGEERQRAERKVRSKGEDETLEPKGETELKSTQKKKNQRDRDMRNEDTHISSREGDKKSKQTKDKGDQKEENRREMITDKNKSKRKGNESRDRKDDIVTTDAAPVNTRASLVFDHPGPLSDGLWKIPSFARILTHEEAMRDVCE